MGEAKHSPLPWLCDKLGNLIYHDCKGIPRVIGSVAKEADRELIVRAVNAHDAMLATCKELIAAIYARRGIAAASIPAAQRLDAAVISGVTLVAIIGEKEPIND